MSRRTMLVSSYWVASAIALAAELVANPDDVYPAAAWIWNLAAILAAPLNLILNSFILPPLLVLFLQYRLLADGRILHSSLLGALTGLPFVALWYFDNGSMPVAFGVLTVAYPSVLGLVAARNHQDP